MTATIPAERFDQLWTATSDYLAAAEKANAARDRLGHVFVDVIVDTGISLHELSIVTGLHRNTVRSMVRRVGSAGLPDGWDQPELPIDAALAVSDGDAPIAGQHPVTRRSVLDLTPDEADGFDAPIVPTSMTVERGEL